MDYTVAESSENALFVQILSNYPNMFQRPTTKSERIKQEYARYTLTHKFNEKCKTNLTVKQISRKINNMKSRLKEKNSKKLLGNKHVKYNDWEILFLNLWTGTDITQLKNDLKTESSETILPNTLNAESMSNSTDVSYKINTNSPTTIIEPSDTEIKIEPKFSSPKDEDDIESVSDISGTQHWHTETEITEPPTEVQFNDINNEDEQYEKMSLVELKRIALISQTKMLKAQEAAARAKEKLSLYKLRILKQRNRKSFQNYF